MTLVMSLERALALGLKPKAFFRGFTVAGCEPDEMGIGPVFSVPKLLKAKGLSVADIDLWELNEAFASQCLYARDRLEIDNARYNVNGGSISIGHPFGMTGSRQVGHLVRELQRRNLRWHRHHVRGRRHGGHGVVRGCTLGFASSASRLPWGRFATCTILFALCRQLSLCRLPARA